MEGNEQIHLRSLVNDDDRRSIVASRVIGAMTEIIVFREEWTMSDYRRSFCGLVVYLRHHSDGDISSFGEFISPFVIGDCELGHEEDVSTNPALDRFLREDARLWYAAELLRHAPSTPAWHRTSEYDKTVYVLTANTQLLSVLADRGFKL